MDKSLDDMIKTSRTKRGGRRRSVRSKVLGNTPTTAAKAAAKKAGAAPVVNGNAPLLPQHAAQKIIVSGLPLDVDEAQIKELFTTGIGPLRSVQMQFDPQGKWTGTATVIFARKGDATKAYEIYNNRLIDGKKPMKVEVIVDLSKLSAPAPSLASRVATTSKTSGAAPAKGAQRTGRPPRRGRGPRPKKEGRPQKTAEDLDAEMEDYTAASNAPAAVAASAA